MNEINKRMHDLIGQIRQTDTAYYKHDAPVMPDLSYDQLVDELHALEEETGIILSSSPIHRVAGEVLDVLSKVEHSKPMLSADKTKSIDDVFKFVGGRPCVVSWKLDGCTLVIRYADGELKQAITRGAEGRVGEDVTHTARKMTNVPLAISFKGPLEIRGEAVISWKNFKQINAELAEPYDHPRNLAAGCLRRKDAGKMEMYPVDFIAYEIVEGIDIDRKQVQHTYLARHGFQVVEAIHLPDGADHDAVERAISSFQPENCPIPVDGLVIEYEDLAYGHSLGATGHHAKRMLAYKWQDELYETTFRGLALATTRTGMVSMTAMFDTVVIGGAEVNRAYLHNIDYVRALRLGVGDKINVYKANMIIPQIAGNLTGSGTLKLPEECPCCGASLVVHESEQGTQMLFCESEGCSSQLLMKFVHFCSKTRMDIVGLSEKSLQRLIEAGFLNNFGDLFALEQRGAAIAGLPGFGPGKVKNMVDAAEKSRRCKLNQFLAGLGIHTVGRTASRTINSHFHGDWNAFEQAIQKNFDFTQLDDFGEIMHNNIYAWYADKEREKLWRPALQYIEFEKEKETSNMSISYIFAGKTVVATGKLEHFTRDGIQMKLLSIGAKPASSVSKKTDFLIVGDGAGSKLMKARTLGVETLTEQEFLSMLPETDPDYISA